MFFGGSDFTPDGSFDPFATVLGEADGEVTNVYGDTDHPGESDSPDGVVRYGRHTDQSDSGYEQDADRPITGERGTVQQVIGADEQRDRDRTDAGIRHLRRVATEHSGSPGTGTVRRSTSEGVASSIADAQERIRAAAGQPLGADERRDIAVASQTFTHGSSKPRTYQKRHVTVAPTFEECEFEATMGGLKSNTAGSWVLTLVIPPHEANGVLQLSASYGLALKVKVERKRYGPNGDT